jgi:hypothetical protein
MKKIIMLFMGFFSITSLGSDLSAIQKLQLVCKRAPDMLHGAIARLATEKKITAPQVTALHAQAEVQIAQINKLCLAASPLNNQSEQAATKLFTQIFGQIQKFIQTLN